MNTTQRLARLERALAEFGHMMNGPQGLPSLRRQAPALADLIQDYYAGTLPSRDATLVGRQETADAPNDREQR